MTDAVSSEPGAATAALTAHDRLRIQMEYAVPLIRDLQRILGEDAVNDALAQRLDDLGEKIARPGAEADFARMRRDAETWAEGGALKFKVVAEGPDRFEMDVHECAYTTMMEELGARDLGPMLVCNVDYALAARVGMTLERTQTVMTGADHCDFRYRRRE